MTCKSCIHFDACSKREKTKYYGKIIACDDVEERCNLFINKADVVKVRHGEWSNTDWSGVAINGYMACTQCNVMIPKCEYNRYCLSYLKYCPNCGAKMDGKEVANNG